MCAKHPSDDQAFILDERTLYEYVYHKDFYESQEQEIMERYGFWTRQLIYNVFAEAEFGNIIVNTLGGEWVKVNRIFPNIDFYTIDADTMLYKAPLAKTSTAIVPDYQVIVVADNKVLGQKQPKLRLELPAAPRTVDRGQARGVVGGGSRAPARCGQGRRRARPRGVLLELDLQKDLPGND